MASRNEIRIRRVYEPAGADDGARILVDRLWPRGVTKNAVALTLWLKDVAPSADLRKWFGHEPARWQEFSRLYRAELDQNAAGVAQLRQFLERGHVTLLYGAHDLTHNHAVVLMNYLREHMKARRRPPAKHPKA